MRRTEALLVALLLVAYLALGALFAVRTPAWQAPDEPAHYNYVRQLVAGDLPVIEPGDYDQDYIAAAVSSRFDPAYPVAGLTYEDWQPPLYYLLQAPVYAATDGSLTAMRLLSVLLGAGVVLLAYFVARVLFDGAVWLALAAAAVVAFVPQHLAILGSVNNDALAELIIAAILLLLVRPWPERPPAGRLLLLGLLVGLGLLTKGTAYLLAPVAGVVVLARYWAQWRPLVRALVMLIAPAAVLGLLWWTRNVAVYDGLDFLARNAHDRVVVGQPRTAEWVAAYGAADTLRRFLQTTFNSFWGQFGWMAAPFPAWVYAPLLALTAAAAVGLALAAARWRALRGHGLGWLALGLTFLLTLGLHAAYNLTFVQHQGRYLFPALIPIAVGFAVGLGYWLRPLVRRRPAAGYALPLLLALGLVGLSLYSLVRIIPALSPP